MRSLLTTLLSLCLTLVMAEDDGNWPSFRGSSSSGVIDGPLLLESWNVESGEGILFRIATPGLAHSSPIIWNDQIFLTTAVSSEASADFKPGLYGSGDASPDRSEHVWQVLCHDKHSGEILWQATAKRAVPQDKRHIKATYANSTPATDGKHVVAFFGSEGLFCFSTEGDLLWQKELGRLDVGAYDLPSYEWGSASSPIIHDGRVFVQCDSQSNSFLIALDVTNGEILWRTPRDELPSWGTPTLYPGDERNAPELITNGSNFIRAYDPRTGAELWRLGGSSKITAPTPVFADGIIIVASGRAPERPIFAIRPGGRGDISSGNHLAWSLTRRGPYMPTPLIYRGNVYVLNNDGPFACYDLQTGAEHYYLRLPHRGDGFSASPVASNGKIYLSSESGEILIVKAGETFEEAISYSLGEPIMATPAISNGVLYVRGARHLIAIGNAQ